MKNGRTLREGVYRIGNTRSLIPELHLQQISQFMFRRGIELFAVGDRDNVLTDFLHLKWRQDQMSIYLDDIWHLGALTGEVLFYIRSLGDCFSLYYYPSNQFLPYYDENLFLYQVDIFELSEDMNRPGEVVRTVRITVDSFSLWEGEGTFGSPVKEWPNIFKFIPCVLVKNIPSKSATRSNNEFESFKSHLHEHHELLGQLHGNLSFFGAPIYYSSRSKSEMIEAGVVEENRDSVAWQSGFKPSGAATEQRVKARRIISGLEPDEQLGFATPDAVQEQIINYINSYAADLRIALGGVPDSGLISNTGALPDYQSRYAQVFVTALRKADIYITYGICSAYEVMIKMAIVTGRLSEHEFDYIGWRYAGDVFPATPANELTKSIVSRNLLRLGVSTKEAVQYIYPDKKEEEIERMLKNGFAYEFFNGLARVLGNVPQDVDYNNFTIMDVLNGAENERAKRDGEEIARAAALQRAAT